MTMRERFLAALDKFIEKVKPDPNIIAVVLEGSLAYDTVWEKSDIDLTVVVRDQHLETAEYTIDEDGLVLNASLMTRSSFLRSLERNIGGGFGHSLFAKSRVVYSKDDSLVDFVEEMRSIGRDDAARSFLIGSGSLISWRDKAEKWLTIKDDPLYAQFYLLKAAEALAALEVCRHQEPPTREAILRVQEIQPGLIERFYQLPLSRNLSREEIAAAIAAIDDYLTTHLDFWSEPVLTYMADGEIKTLTMLCRHFGLSSHYAVKIFDYLAMRRVIERVSQTIRLTAKGRKSVEEIAYIYIN